MDETSGPDPLPPAGDGTAAAATVYHERPLPGPGIWAVLIGVGAAFGVIVLPLGSAVGLVAGAVAIVVLVTLGWLSTAVIEVTGSELRAGRAVISRGFVRAVEPLDTEQMRVARGTGLDARAFLCLRGWVAAGVRVRIEDPDDPTPYWLISSRRPQALAEALTTH